MLPVLLLIGGAPASDWIRMVEVTSEPEANGQKDYTIRFAPRKTQLCDKVVFECVYHQEFPWEDVWGKKYTKMHEPVPFTYQRAKVKFVNDLDEYVSFRIPVSMERLKEKYGPKVFNKDYPVTVDRIEISGMVKGETIWSFSVPAKGKYILAELLRR